MKLLRWYRIVYAFIAARYNLNFTLYIHVFPGEMNKNENMKVTKVYIQLSCSRNTLHYAL